MEEWQSPSGESPGHAGKSGAWPQGLQARDKEDQETVSHLGRRWCPCHEDRHSTSDDQKEGRLVFSTVFNNGTMVM